MPATAASIEKFSDRLERRFSEFSVTYENCVEQIIMDVPVASLIEVATVLRDNNEHQTSFVHFQMPRSHIRKENFFLRQVLLD